MPGTNDEKKRLMKEIIKRLHEGASPEEVRKSFREVVKEASPEEIAKVEEELIREGMPREEVHRLCDVHMAVFKESLEQERPIAPPGHPIHTLMEEHKMLLSFAEQLKFSLERLKGGLEGDALEKELLGLDSIVKHLKESESHYLREENVLFPYLEKHGVKEPPAIMWMEHDKIRAIKKGIYELYGSGKDGISAETAGQLQGRAVALADMLSQHFYKENNILFPASMKVISREEWPEIRSQFDEIGYCCFTPASAREAAAAPKERAAAPTLAEGEVRLETGTFSVAELEAVLNALPVDITFVDGEDTVRYFSQSKERIFTRTKAVIGRKVQQCHPQKSVHAVERILEEFRSGKRDLAEFWINMNGRLIHIRYFPVRDSQNNYMGCIEVTQDITEIRKIEGEKRLL